MKSKGKQQAKTRRRIRAIEKSLEVKHEIMMGRVCRRRT